MGSSHSNGNKRPALAPVSPPATLGEEEKEGEEEEGERREKTKKEKEREEEREKGGGEGGREGGREGGGEYKEHKYERKMRYILLLSCES